ncbi:hypothetical protein N5923_23510 [Erwiniaceae bacterium BAC15a-03b]|uniref:Uncharacterized protein n=1 Tax=Winslowiella arboricola TaxID=2978220 RepID=A0A9J6PYD0_9GAMM|nr:hypothetical protein [Winslowiella arboricola]MCU5775082.1 hypothetical protein [Winslowiella arboricola]MCU5780464.1 hypothetical protein [Winslowiella arboricola]
MSDIANPSANSKIAAQQIIVELIRAGKLGAGDSGDQIIAIYENLVAQYDRISRK